MSKLDQVLHQADLHMYELATVRAELRMARRRDDPDAVVAELQAQADTALRNLRESMRLALRVALYGPMHGKGATR
jgi:hypothetical protein